MALSVSSTIATVSQSRACASTCARKPGVVRCWSTAFMAGSRSRAKAPRTADGPRASSIRRASFHLAVRSDRANDPTLSWPTPQPTARCTMVTSSDSPDRADTMADHPAARRCRQRRQRFRDGTGLVRLQQHRVARAARVPPRPRDPRMSRDSRPPRSGFAHPSWP